MKRLDLAGTWQLAQADAAHQTSDASIYAQVPGDNASALLAAGKLPDPYYGMNEKQVQWIGASAWVYARDVDVPQAFFDEESIYLHFDSLDTFATIYINDHQVAVSDNMFCRQRFEVKPFLVAGVNRVRIVFAPPYAKGTEFSKSVPYPIPYALNSQYSSHRNLLRKVQCHFGWDWGVSLPVSGIYGACYLAATSTPRIEYVTTEVAFQGDDAIVTVTCEVTASSEMDVDVRVVLDGEAKASIRHVREGGQCFSESMKVSNVIRWWPAGYGDPHLYSLLVSVGDETIEKRIGLRELVIINDEDAHGLSFTVRVNGVDVFCKGANWIPVDAMPQRHTRQRYEELLESARLAHMNMLRVWGGGQYEEDAFYEICDEKGILVWQDFMFACALYPANKTFLQSVNAEVRHQIKRLRDHPCIALWCGNNEDIGALGWFQESRENRDRYLVDYDRLNEGVIGKAVDECDPTRIFWPSSPCGGRDDYSDCFHKDGRGDMHYWDVWHSGKSLDAYYDVVPRFCSEFGYQSFPSMSQIQTYATPDQYNVTSPVMEWHQKNRRGNSIILEMFTRYFRMPEGFENFIYLSQIQQAVAIRTAVEFWRSLRPLCMGTLYWQLNDNWPVCSWSSLNYDGSWKALHYMAKRFYAPVMLTIFQRKYGNPVEIWGVNDTGTTRTSTMRVMVKDFSGETVWQSEKQVTLSKHSAIKFEEYSVADLTPSPETVFIVVELDTDEGMIRNDLFLAEYKCCALADAHVTAQISERPDGKYDVALRTDAPAFFVTLETDGMSGCFDDNVVTLLPDECRTVVFRPKDSLGNMKLEEQLRVRHLRQTYT